MKLHDFLPKRWRPKTEGVRSDLTPWLGSLYVVPSYRKQNIGQTLVDAIKQIAKSMGYETLYLATFEPDLNPYFTHQGWELMGKDVLNDHPVSIMALELV